MRGGPSISVPSGGPAPRVAFIPSSNPRSAAFSSVSGYWHDIYTQPEYTDFENSKIDSNYSNGTPTQTQEEKQPQPLPEVKYDGLLPAWQTVETSTQNEYYYEIKEGENDEQNKEVDTKQTENSINNKRKAGTTNAFAFDDSIVESDSESEPEIDHKTMEYLDKDQQPTEKVSFIKRKPNSKQKNTRKKIE